MDANPHASMIPHPHPPTPTHAHTHTVAPTHTVARTHALHARVHAYTCVRHARTHARTHARMHGRTHTRTHAYTHARADLDLARRDHTVQHERPLDAAPQRAADLAHPAHELRRNASDRHHRMRGAASELLAALGPAGSRGADAAVDKGGRCSASCG
jgi:hypothetical protein